jgi:uncharacterized membrane protein
MTPEFDPATIEHLRLRLDAMRRKLDVLTNKQARAEAAYEIARIRWRLGEIDDAELQRIEAFYERFTYE